MFPFTTKQFYYITRTGGKEYPPQVDISGVNPETGLLQQKHPHHLINEHALQRLQRSLGDVVAPISD